MATILRLAKSASAASKPCRYGSVSFCPQQPTLLRAFGTLGFHHKGKDSPIFSDRRRTLNALEAFLSSSSLNITHLSAQQRSFGTAAVVGDDSSSSATPFLLADIGEGIAEVELLQWFVQKGDQVHQFDKICEVQSDKATVEITSRYDGRIISLEHNIGDMVKVGTPILFLEPDHDADNAQVGAAASVPKVEPAPENPMAKEVTKPPPPPTATTSKDGAVKVVPFLLADIGEGIAEVELLQWFVQKGDNVHQFDRICEVQSDKATVEITSRFDGRISSLEHAVGDMVKVGSPILFLETEGNPDNESTSASSHLHTASTGNEPMAEDERLQIPSATSSFGSSSGHKIQSSTIEAATNTSDKVLTSPAIRKLAKEHSLQLGTVAGSGPKGRILKSDILAILKKRGLTPPKPTSSPDVVPASPTPSSSPVPSSKSTAATSSPKSITSISQVELPLQQNTTLELRGYNRLMAQTMTASLQIPHMGYADEINVTSLRTQYKSHLPFLPYCIKAASMALSKFPLLNATYDDGSDGGQQKVTLWADHNIGIAMDTPRGLIVPVIRQVQHKSISDIVEDLKRLKEAARDSAVPPEDLQGATFTLSNIGSIGRGGTYMNPIITRPQVAIGALGGVQRVPRFVSDDSLEVSEAYVFNVSWAGDHRVIDGATLARFHAQWKTYLEDPVCLIQEMK